MRAKLSTAKNVCTRFYCCAALNFLCGLQPNQQVLDRKDTPSKARHLIPAKFAMHISLLAKSCSNHSRCELVSGSMVQSTFQKCKIQSTALFLSHRAGKKSENLFKKVYLVHLRQVGCFQYEFESEEEVARLYVHSRI